MIATKCPPPTIPKMSARTTFRIYDSAGVRCATAVSIAPKGVDACNGKLLAVPEKIVYDSPCDWKNAVEEKFGHGLTLKTETRDGIPWNRPLTQIGGYNTAKKLKAHYEKLTDDQRLILSLAHNHGLKECITPRGFFKPTSIYAQTASEDGFSIVPVHFNRWGKLKVAHRDATELPRYCGSLNLLLEEHGVYKQITRFPSQDLPPADVPVVILESNSRYFYAKVQEEIKRLVAAGYYVEVILAEKRPNLGTSKRLAELYRRAEHKFTVPRYCSYPDSVRSVYNNQTVDQYLAARWTLAEVDGQTQEWFKGDIICSRLRDSVHSWKMGQRFQELAEASVWNE